MTRDDLPRLASSLAEAGAIDRTQADGFAMLFAMVWDEAQRAAPSREGAAPSPVDAPSPAPEDPRHGR